MDFFIDSLLKATWGQTLVNVILLILCLYPITGSFFWFAGALSYRFLKTKKRDTNWQVIPAKRQPLITIMIPAHNEEVMIGETITYLFEQVNNSNADKRI